MNPQRVTRLSVRALVAITPLLALSVLSTGCARNSADLRLTSLENDATFLQHFSRAYVSKGPVGGTEIVLVNEQALASATARAGEPIHASSAGGGPTGVRQVMHLKVLWKPQRGTKQSHPSYTNAALRWYVFHDAGDDGSAGDVLEYSGAGFVALTETAAGTQVTIRNATLKPVGTPRGSLTDPVGPARLTGTFIAKKSPQRVSALLAEVKTVVDGATTPQASAR